MNNEIVHQIGQVMVDSNHGLSSRIGELAGSVVTLTWLWVGAVGGAFTRIMDPQTWDMTTLASFISVIVALNYLRTLRRQRRLADKQLELAEIQIQKLSKEQAE
jgi:hypothetical protein